MGQSGEAERAVPGVILVPLDGSSLGEEALGAAVAIARRTGARLELAHVEQHLPPGRLAPALARQEGETGAQRVLAYLRHLAAGAAAAGVQASHPVVLAGPAVPTLLRHAEQTGADLVVLARHGGGPRRRAWPGSVAEGLARQAPIPVLLVKPGLGSLALPPDAPLFRHVLVPLGASSFGQAVLPAATAIGALGGARYMLVRVLFPRYPSGHAYETAHLSGEEERVAEARGALEAVAAGLRADGLQVQTVVLLGASTSNAILGFARDNGVDLIARTTHGLRGLGRLVLTSVAESVLRRAATPLLFLHPRSGQAERWPVPGR